MNYVGKTVKHKVFGNGTVVELDKSYMFIQFDFDNQIRKFAYPNIKSFITIANDNLMNEDSSEKNQDHLEKDIKKPINLKLATYNSVTSFCDEYSKAIFCEIGALQRNKSNKHKIYDGKQIEYSNDMYAYSFETDDELSLPEGTSVSLWESELSYSGTIISCEDFTILLYTNHDFGETVSELEMESQSWMLLSSLSDRLAEIKESPTKIVKSLICDGEKNINQKTHKIKSGQDNALKMALKNKITFIWGPPGTGKTETLANIAINYLKLGKRILMVSYSNVSVDGAILRVHHLKKRKKPGEIVRYGNARSDELLSHEYLTSSNLAIYNHPELVEEKKRLNSEKKSVKRDSKRLLEINQRLSQIKKELKEEERYAVSCASFIVTTVSMAIVNNTIKDSKYDVVIFDEASMAYIPQVTYSASLATEHFICLGDFRQLPPIVQSGEESILNSDIFNYCGIVSAVNHGYSHKWLCMLDTQYRMEENIATFVGNSFYNSLLNTGDGVSKKRNTIIKSNPFKGQSISFADLSGMMSVCMKTKDQSRFNILSAFVSFGLAASSRKKLEVGIITPYKAQSRLLHAMSRDLTKANENTFEISCATVHQFQGSEKEIIVYDAVDCYRMHHPGMLLSSEFNDYANRLFNVAMTRARGKFIAVANVDYMSRKNLSKELLFKQLIDQQKSNSNMVSGNQLLSEITNNAIIQFYDEKDSIKIFLEDLEKSKIEINIDIPSKPIVDNDFKKMFDLLKKLKEKGVKIIVRVEDKKDIPLEYQSIIVQNSSVMNPIAILDKKIIWYGMPNSCANFITKSSTIYTTYFPCIRFLGRNTAKSLYSLLNMANTMDNATNLVTDDFGNAFTDTFASYVLANRTCPNCGKPMKFKKSRTGKFFLGCSKYPYCKTTEWIDTDLVDEYLYRNGGTGQKCPKCGSSLEAIKGKYGIYVRCCGYEHHIIKLDKI